MEVNMTFLEWLNIEKIENPAQHNQWGPLHITVVLLCIAACVGISFLRRKSKTLKVGTIRALAACLLIFEISRRIVTFIIDKESFAHITTLGGYLENRLFWYIILPRPWFAISVWLIIVASIVNKRVMYNIAAMNAIICAIIFFAYPSAGFNNEIMQFENVYSISTHALILVAAVSMITLGLTDFKYVRTKWYNSAIWELLAIGLVFAYAFMLVNKGIELNPMYFVPTGALGKPNEVQDILGMSDGVYVAVYALFLTFYFNLFFLIQLLVDKVKAKKGGRKCRPRCRRGSIRNEKGRHTATFF